MRQKQSLMFEIIDGHRWRKGEDGPLAGSGREIDLLACLLASCFQWPMGRHQLECFFGMHIEIVVIIYFVPHELHYTTPS